MLLQVGILVFESCREYWLNNKSPRECGCNFCYFTKQKDQLHSCGSLYLH